MVLLLPWDVNVASRSATAQGATVQMLVANGVVDAYEIWHVVLLLQAGGHGRPRRETRQQRYAECLLCCKAGALLSSRLWHHPSLAHGRPAQ